jgi:hypothetical protein
MALTGRTAGFSAPKSVSRRFSPNLRSPRQWGIEAMKDTAGELTIKSELGPDGQLLISVTDTGVGLPAEKMDQIFESFFTTKAQGSGMGLAISRSIIESHGGRLWASANSGRGSDGSVHRACRGDSVIALGRLKRFDEKVIKVKADVAADVAALLIFVLAQ